MKNTTTISLVPTVVDGYETDNLLRLLFDQQLKTFVTEDGLLVIFTHAPNHPTTFEDKQQALRAETHEAKKTIRHRLKRQADLDNDERQAIIDEYIKHQTIRTTRRIQRDHTPNDDGVTRNGAARHLRHLLLSRRNIQTVIEPHSEVRTETRYVSDGTVDNTKIVYSAPYGDSFTAAGYLAAFGTPFTG